MSVFVDAKRERPASGSENRHRTFHGLRDPLVRRVLFVLVVAVVGVLVLALRGGSGDRHSFMFTPSTKQLPSVGAVSVVGLASTPGRVSPALAREAVSVADSDPTLVRLVRLGGGQRVGSISPWFVGNDHNGGAVLAYRLRRPIAVNSDLPYVALTPDAPAHGTCVSPYAQGWAHLHASRVTRLSALVDLRQKRVVDIGTDAKRGTGTVGPVAGKPYPSCNEDQPG